MRLREFFTSLPKPGTVVAVHGASRTPFRGVVLRGEGTTNIVVRSMLSNTEIIVPWNNCTYAKRP